MTVHELHQLHGFDGTLITMIFKLCVMRYANRTRIEWIERISTDF